MTSPLSSKDTKQAIWEAYQVLLEKYQSLEQSKMSFSPEIPNIKKPPKVTDFFDALEGLKRQFIADLDIYAEKTREKYSVIEVLTDELNSLERRLQEGEKIQTEVASLYALIELQQKKRQEFEEEIETRKREQKQKELDWQYAWEEKKRNEEYSYKQKREDVDRKWNDEFTKKTTELRKREDELLEREKVMDELQSEIITLQKTLDTLPQKLEGDITERLSQEFATEKKFINKEWEMQSGVMKLEIRNLEERLSDLQKQNAELTKTLANAHARMESFASKIIESGRPVMIPKGE